MKSVYVLQFSVGELGGMAWTEHHLVTTPEQVRAVVDELCRAPSKRRENCFWYDTVIGVWVVQQGEVRSFVDLREQIVANPSGRAVPLNQLIAENFDPEEATDAGALPSLKLDWRHAQMLLPPLAAPLMEPGDELTFTHAVSDAWLANTQGATLGSHFMP